MELKTNNQNGQATTEKGLVVNWNKGINQVQSSTGLTITVVEDQNGSRVVVTPKEAAKYINTTEIEKVLKSVNNEVKKL